MVTCYADSIFKAQCGILMKSLNLTTTSFESIAEYSFPIIFYFCLSIWTKNIPDQFSAKY